MSGSLLGKQWICASCRRYAVVKRRFTSFAAASSNQSQSPQPAETDQEFPDQVDIPPRKIGIKATRWEQRQSTQQSLDAARKIFKESGYPAKELQRDKVAARVRSQTSFKRPPADINATPQEPHESKAKKPELPAQKKTLRNTFNLPEPDVAVRTRFAPSPTGHLHIGGLRTALFSYLLARRCGGKFILRIEDTDQKRLVPGAEQKLKDDLRWAGLWWDEGPDVDGPFGSYRQSERTEIYQAHARELLDKGAAYRCFCPPQAAGEAGAEYVTSGCYGGCDALETEESQERADSGSEAFTVRLHKPRDAKKRVYPDLVHKFITPVHRQRSSSSDEDGATVGNDTILIKSDGTPTYHFANVVDDHLMQITHVIRGDEWLASTPLHYDLYTAFGWEPPKFAHVNLLVDANGAKLSKRNAEVGFDVASMRDEQKIRPEVLNNFLLLLGWSNPRKDDHYDMDQMIANFDLKFTKGTAQVRTEKLIYLKRSHLVNTCKNIKNHHPVDDAMREMLRDISAEVKERFPEFVAPERQPFVRYPAFKQDDMDPLTQYCAELLVLHPQSYDDAKQFVESHRYFFERPPPAPFASEPGSESEKEAIEDTNAVLESALLHHDYLRPYDLDPYPPFTPEEDWSNGESLRMELTVDHPTLKMRVARVWAAMFRAYFMRTVEKQFPSPQDRQKFYDHFPNFSVYPRIPTLNALIFEAAGFGPENPSPVDLHAFSKLQMGAAGPVNPRIRLLLFGGAPGPSLNESMAILGYEECCERLGLTPVPEPWPGAGSGWEVRKLAVQDAVARSDEQPASS